MGASKTALGRVVASLIALAAASVVVVAQRPAAQERLAFRAAVDIIPVDVVVLDAAGNQVTDLASEAFTVTIDGRPRRIVSWRYIGYASPRVPAAASPVPRAHVRASRPVSSNLEAPGRFVMVVVDEAGMEFGGIRTAAQGLQHFLDGLDTRDSVGLAVLPYGGVVVPFTRDHARILDPMTRLAGRSLRRQSLTNKNITWAEALEHMRDPLGIGWNTVIERVCAYCGGVGTQRELSVCMTECKSSSEAAASGMAAEMRQRSQEFRASARNVLSYLAAIDAPKIVVLLSSGLVTEPTDTDLVALGNDAAAAGCSIYVLHFNAWDLPDASERLPSPIGSADLQLQRTSLEALAGRTRGWVYDLVGGAGPALDKLAREVAGYYLLGVEAEPSDRDGKRHQIRVDVARKNVSTRARRELAPRAGRAAVRSATDDVRALLASPANANDVRLRVTSYVEPAAESGKLKVLISAEVGQETTVPEELTVGWALVRDNGKPWAGGSERVTLRPPAGRTAAPLSFVRTEAVEAGRYLFKLAVVDSHGRRGSVAHEIDAGLHAAGSLVIGDLVIGTPPVDAKSRLEPPVECVIEDDRLLVYLPVTTAHPQTLARARATVEIARGEEEQSLLHASLPLTGKSADQRALTVSIGLGLLPPGSYVARVRLSAGEEVVATIARGFLFAPGSDVRARAGAEGGGSVLPMAPFVLGELLDPRALASVLDRAAKAAPDLPSAVFAEARAGRLASAAQAVPADAAGPVPPFLRGLALLERRDLEAARKEFSESRHQDPEFMDAVLFLGVCYAAGGRQNEATGALQTTRFGLDDEPMVHHLLIDTRLRRGQVDEARALVDQAAKRWPTDARFQRQMAAVLAAGNDPAQALAVLGRYLDEHGDDAQALFLALQLLYETAARSNANAPPPADLVDRFRKYAEMYDAAGGSESALVAEWVKSLTR